MPKNDNIWNDDNPLGYIIEARTWMEAEKSRNSKVPMRQEDWEFLISRLLEAERLLDPEKDNEGTNDQSQSMTHIEKAIASYYSAAHPGISWGLQESGLSVAHAVTYDLKSWCGEDGFQYVLANPKQSGLTYCSRCIKALEEAGIDSEV
jgi:hypothetical protein